MTRDDFDALVARLEELSGQRPKAYVLRTAALIVLAYGYLALVVFGSLASISILVPIILEAPDEFTGRIVSGVLAFPVMLVLLLARGFWGTRFQPPKGLQVKRSEAPDLFALLDELRSALKCDPFHRVLFDGDFNAGVVQIPRLGLFGWHRNFLRLGLPLMQSLGPDEFKAVLAHEFAHSSRGHGRFGNWLYRVRRSWERIFEKMSQDTALVDWVVRTFIGWYWPKLNAHAFVLARANEYEADAAAVRLAGPDAMAGALLRCAVDGQLVSDKFWPAVAALAARRSTPPADVMEKLRRVLRKGPAAPDAARWLRQAYLQETDCNDTHPCLKDRLRAMGRLPEESGRAAPAAPPARTAAECFLGPLERELAAELSGAWSEAVAVDWAARHEHAQRTARELGEFDERASAQLGPADLWAKACKLIDVHGDAVALGVLRRLLALQPKHAGANLVCGRIHLQRDDPAGIALVEAAAAEDPDLLPGVCELLHAHFVRTGQRDKLRPLEHRWDEFQRVAQAARAERERLAADDSFVTPSELTPDQVAAVRGAVESEREVASAALVRKTVRHRPESPCYVVALRLRIAWWKPRSSNATAQLVQRVLAAFAVPGYQLVFVDEGELHGIAKRVFAVPGAVILDRRPRR